MSAQGPTDRGDRAESSVPAEIAEALAQLSWLPGSPRRRKPFVVRRGDRLVEAVKHAAPDLREQIARQINASHEEPLKRNRSITAHQALVDRSVPLVERSLLGLALL